MTSYLPDGEIEIFADQGDMTILTYFTCMVKIVALKFNTPPTHPPTHQPTLVRRCLLSDLVISNVLDTKWKIFNQNQLKLHYMLSQTYICTLSAHSDHGHLCWASRKTSFQCLHLHRAAINTCYEKNIRDFFTSWNFDLMLWFAVKILII